MANSELGGAMQTPLNGQTYQSDGLTVKELKLCSKVVLRADFDHADTCAAIEGVIGLSPVLSANTFNANADSSLYWMGPDERLLYSDSQDSEGLVKTLRAKLPQGRSAVVDVSDYYTVLRISGNHARQVLASGTPFDVHERVFKQGQCAQTRFGNASLLLSCRQDTPEYDVQVRWSFAEYLWGYLCRVDSYV